jgi:hypothetical protein
VMRERAPDRRRILEIELRAVDRDDAAERRERRRELATQLALRARDEDARRGALHARQGYVCAAASGVPAASLAASCGAAMGHAMPSA